MLFFYFLIGLLKLKVNLLKKLFKKHTNVNTIFYDYVMEPKYVDLMLIVNVIRNKFKKSAEI